MPKVSKETASEVADFAVAEDRSHRLDGYTVNFVSIHEDSDLTPLLAGLPGGLCPCPHWGYLFKGRMTVRYADREEEVIEPGDAYYLSPGHVPFAEAGSEFISFSPSEELRVVEEAMAKAMQAMTGS